MDPRSVRINCGRLAESEHHGLVLVRLVYLFSLRIENSDNQTLLRLGANPGFPATRPTLGSMAFSPEETPARPLLGLRNL